MPNDGFKKGLDGLDTGPTPTPEGDAGAPPQSGDLPPHPTADALRTVPLSTTVELAREFHNQNAREVAGGKIEDPHWSGRVPGSMSYEGSYREWGKAMSGAGGWMEGGQPL